MLPQKLFCLCWLSTSLKASHMLLTKCSLQKVNYVGVCVPCEGAKSGKVETFSTLARAVFDWQLIYWRALIYKHHVTLPIVTPSIECLYPEGNKHGHVTLMLYRGGMLRANELHLTRGEGLWRKPCNCRELNASRWASTFSPGNHGQMAWPQEMLYHLIRLLMASLEEFLFNFSCPLSLVLVTHNHIHEIQHTPKLVIQDL